MQDVQNIPNPDVNSPTAGEDFDSHPRSSNEDIERPEEDIPVPPGDAQRAPVEEPPDVQDKPPVEEDQTEPEQLV